MTASLRLALALASALLLSAPLLAAEPWDAPPFSADPKALLEAAQKVDPGKADLVLLLDQTTFVFDEQGHARSEVRFIYRVVTENGVEMIDTASASWAPWYAERPEIRARVVARDGAVHVLDPRSVTEASAELERDIFSDERVLRAPLPGVAAGSIVEIVTAERSASVIPGAGTSSIFTFASGVPEERIRLILDGPASFQPHIVNKSGVEPRVVEKDGRKQIIFEHGHADAVENDERYLPSDQMRFPYVAFSTGTSWADLAARYGEIVDKQIAAGDLRETAAAATRGATERQQVVARLLAYVESNVHYAGVEVGDGSIIPRPPRAVLQNKYGDCKDKATLLAGLARAAGLSAHVVLLDAGSGFDVLNELPSLARFNHAIVVIDGETPIWVDPTDEFARAGELPPEDQGRLALIASAATTSLTRTPEMPGRANRYMETRTFMLPEEGKARVVEVTEGTGPEEAQLRRNRAESDAGKYKESIEKYAKSYYFAQKLEKLTVTEPRDLTKPFSITIEVGGSRSGIVKNGDAAVAINLADILSRAPSTLLDYREPGQTDADAPPAKKRVHDFAFPKSFVTEWRYRIVLPPGYKARTLPENETKRLGTATLTQELGTGPDGVVFANFVFDTGKRRLTPAELEETRIALSRFYESKQMVLGFDSIGQAKLNAGDVRGALDEFRRLAALHPKEAQHHLDQARALLSGGLGEAARQEARRAVAIEPASAHAHAILGAILQHDLLGREYHSGFDLPGALTALRKAKELDPNDLETRTALAEALTHGDDGFRFGRHARLGEAVDEYKAIFKQFGADARGYQPRLMLFLAYAGRWDEMKTFVETMEDGEQKKLGRLLAAAGGSGVPAAMHELDAYQGSERREKAARVGQTLMAMGLYPQASAMFEVASQGAPNATELQTLIQVLKKTQRGGPPDDGKPAAVLTKLVRGLLLEDLEALKNLVAPEYADDVNVDQLGFSPRAIPMGDVTPATMADLLPAMTETRTSGDETVGYRLRTRMAGMTASDTIVAFVRREGTKYVIAAVATEPSGIGSAVLKMAAAGQLEAARTWLNWAREDIESGGGDDPLSGPPFAALWPKEKATATLEEIRLAAAALSSTKKDGAKAVPILTAARDAATEAQKSWIDVALVRASAEPAAALLPATRLAAAHPESAFAFGAWVGALAATGKVAEAETAAKQRLERSPRDHAAMHALSLIEARKGDYAAATAFARRILDELKATEDDYNDYAWIALFAGRDLERATEEARHASGGRGSLGAAALHTLAAVYAESGKNVEARQALLQAIDKRMSDKPTAADWYVVGRIAENYGVPEAALAAYKRVEKVTPDGLTTWELAQRRLAAMK